MDARAIYQSLESWQKETALLGSIAGVLGWDQRVTMPPKAAPHRANQLAMLSGMIHQRATDPRIGEWLSQLKSSELTQPPDSVPPSTSASGDANTTNSPSCPPIW
jgi:carboxypeptidase Taq